MNLLYGHSATVARFVSSLIPECRDRGQEAMTAIGVLDDHNRLIGGVIFHDWQPERGTIEVSGAAVTPRWMTRRLLTAVGQYVFDQMECQALVTRLSADNERLASIWERVGGTVHRIPRLFGRHRDGLWVMVTDDAWRQSKLNPRRESHEQAQSAAAG